jgi:histidyl-tRNA synthetase
LRAIDKLDRLGAEEVEKLLGSGRKDESGDYTKGAGLSPVAISRIVNFTGWGERGSGAISTARSNEVTIANFETAVAGSALGEAGVRELAAIRDIARAGGYDDGRIVIDPSVVRGLEYYTGPVFEVELTFPIEGEDGKPVRFGSVAGGGRYDGLVGRFRAENIPATGISIGVSRLMAALQHLKKIDTQAEAGPVVVTVFDPDRIADYQKMVAALRAANIRAELYLGAGKFGAQMKYADRRGAPCAIIQGGDEKAKGEVQIKDLILGASIAQIKDREEYKAAQAKAQYAVPEGQLVDEVRKLLGKHGVSWS